MITIVTVNGGERRRLHYADEIGRLGQWKVEKFPTPIVVLCRCCSQWCWSVIFAALLPREHILAVDCRAHVEFSDFVPLSRVELSIQSRWRGDAGTYLGPNLKMQC